MSDSAELRLQLVRALEASGALGDGRVREAFLAVRRERFLPEVATRDGLAAVYTDRAIVTRTDPRTGAPTSSSSQPAVMAAMLEALDVHPGHRVLEIGAGTGYNAALLAHLAGPAGSVTTVEIDPDLADRARAALAAGGRGAAVDVEVGDGHAGWVTRAPYDRLVATASTSAVPRAWFDQLAPGGVLVVPLRLAGPGVQAVVALRRDGPGLRSVRVIPGAFMALRGDGAVAPEPAMPSLTVTLFDGAQERALVALSGPGLTGMAPGAARRLASLLLGRPRTSPVPAADHGRPETFLALWEPEGNHIVHAFGLADDGSVASGTGTVSPDGAGAALLVRQRGEAARLEAYGDPSAESRLRDALCEWQARGCPTAVDLVFEVPFDGGNPHAGVPRVRWQSDLDGEAP